MYPRCLSAGALALAILVLLSACSAPAESKDPASPPADTGTPQPSSTADILTIGSIAYVEAADANSSGGFDPRISGLHRPGLPPVTEFRVDAKWNATLGTFLDIAFINMYTPGGSASAEGTYTLSSAAGTGGQAELGVMSQDAAHATLLRCLADAGTLTVDSDGGPGHAVTGTLSVTAWKAPVIACPDVPAAGQFRFIRDPNFGNSGAQGDSFALTPNGGATTTYTENGTTLYDPLVDAFFLAGYPTSFTIDAFAGADLAAASYTELIFVQLTPLPTDFDTAGGTFTAGSGAVISYTNAENVSCVANVDAGTAVVGPYTEVGTRFTVDLTVTAFGNSAFCTAPPATPWTAHIVVTRDADQ